MCGVGGPPHFASEVGGRIHKRQWMGGLNRLFKSSDILYYIRNMSIYVCILIDQFMSVIGSQDFSVPVNWTWSKYGFE